MATWNSDNIILTKLGEQMLSKVQAGIGKLTVSRIVSGAGHVSPAQLYNQTQVTDIKQELSIVKYSTNESQSVISVNMSNTELTEAYDLYQIGIYATHPDFEGEVLYLIAQCNSPDHIPVAGDNPVTLSYDLVMAHSGTKEVVINVSEAGHVDVTTFTEFVENTNTTLSNILNDVKGKMGYIDLGDTETDLDSCVGEIDKTVCYYCKNWKNSPASPAWGTATGGKVDLYETKSGAVIVINENYTNNVFTPWTVDKNKGFVSQLFIPMGGLSPYTRSTAGLDSSWKCVSDGGNAKKLDSKSSADFAQNLGFWSSGDIKDLVLKSNSGFTTISASVTGMPVDNLAWIATVNASSTHRQISVQPFGAPSDMYTLIYNAATSTWSKWVKLDAGTLNGKSANSFMQDLGGITTGSLLEYVLSIDVSGVLVAGPGVTDTPNPGRTFFIEVRNYNGYLELIACETGTGTISVNNYNRKQWYGWKTGGDSDTLDGKHASEFASVRKITTQAEVDSFLETGIYSVEGVATTFGSIISAYYMLIVNRHRTDFNYNVELAIPYVDGLQQGVYYRNCASNTWGTWTNVADNGNASKLSDIPASGFLQNFTQWTSGSVKDHLLATKTSGVVWIDKSCTDLPTNVSATWWYGIVLHSVTHYCLIVTNINNNSTFAITYNAGIPSWTNWRDLSNGGNALMVNGHTVQSDVPANAKFTDTVYSSGANINVSGTTINNAGVRAIGTGSANGTISVNTNGSVANVAVKGLGNAAYQFLQTAAGTVGVRRMSAGTAEANDTNCPVGCWYGQYE